MDNSNRTTQQDAYTTQFRNTAAMDEPPLSPNSDINRRSTDDPFAAQREGDGFKWDPFSTERRSSAAGSEGAEVPMAQRDRRMSKEWDASKVPPSRFQKREGSIHATPASRDGQVDRNKLDAIKEKYYPKDKRKSSS